MKAATKKHIIIWASALVLLSAGLVIWARMALPPDYLRSLVMQEGERRLNGHLKLGEVSLMFFPQFGIRVDDFSLALDNRDDVPLQFDEFVLRLEIWPLLSGQLAVHEVDLYSPKVAIETHSDGTSNWSHILSEQVDSADDVPAAVESGPEPTNLAIDISDIIIQNGTIIYSDSVTSTSMTANGVNSRTSLSGVNVRNRIDIVGELSVADLTYGTEGDKFTQNVVSLSYSAIYDPSYSTFSIGHATLSLNGLASDITLTVSDLDATYQQYQVSVRSRDWTLPAILASLPPEVRSESPLTSSGGSIALDAEIDGTTGDETLPEATGTLIIQDAVLNQDDLAVPPSGIAGILTLRDDQLKIDNIGIRLGASDLQITGTYGSVMASPAALQPKANLSISSDLLNVDEFLLSSTADTANSDLQPFPSMEVTADAAVKRVIVNGVEVSDATLKAEIKSQVLTVSDIRARAYGGTVTGSMTQDLSDLSAPAMAMAGGWKTLTSVPLSPD